MGAPTKFCQPESVATGQVLINAFTGKVLGWYFTTSFLPACRTFGSPNRTPTPNCLHDYLSLLT